MKKIFLVDWVGGRAGMQCSVRSPSHSTVPYSMKNLIACFHFSLDVQHLIWAISTELLLCYSHKNGNFLYRCIEFNVPRTNINIKLAMVKNHKHITGRPDQLYPRVFALRPNRALLVLVSFKRVIGERTLALRLRTSATRSASRTRVPSFSFAEK